jgi:hypothetical protein
MVFQTWPCQTWPCQLLAANVVASPKIPSLPAHWYAATSVKQTAPSKTSAAIIKQTSPNPPTMPQSGPFDYGRKFKLTHSPKSDLRLARIAAIGALVVAKNQAQNAGCPQML